MTGQVARRRCAASCLRPLKKAGLMVPVGTLRRIAEAALRIWKTPDLRISALALSLLLFVSAVPTQAAIIDFTTGTFECSFAVLDPITNYRDQGVVVSNNFWVALGGNNVTCPAGYPDAYRPALPWPAGMTSYLGYVSISATSEIVRIEASGLGPRDENGFGELCAVPGGFSCESPLAVRLPAAATAFNLSGLGWAGVTLVGAYGFPIVVREIETVPEPASGVLAGLGVAGLTAWRRTRRIRRLPGALSPR